MSQKAMPSLRAYHLDLKRAMPRLDYLESFTDRLGALGYNALLLEVEDKFTYREHPGLAHETALDFPTWSRLAERWRNKGFELIPMVQTLGHAEYVLTKAGYEHLREQPNVDSVYDPVSQEVQALLASQIDDLVACFKPERFVHIGGDETHGLGGGEKSRPIVDREGVGGLYLQHMRPVFDRVRGHELRPMIWCDILLAHPEIVGQFERDLVMTEWDYFTREPREPRTRIWGVGWVDWPGYQAKLGEAHKAMLDGYAVDEQTHRDGTFPTFYYLDVLADMGFDVVACPANRCSGDTVGIADVTRHVPNGYRYAYKGARRGLGTLMTSWAIRHGHPETTWPSTYAAARAMDSQARAELDIDAMLNDCAGACFGVACPEFAQAARLASVRVPMSESNTLLAPMRAVEAGETARAAAWKQLGEEHAPELLRPRRHGIAQALAVFHQLRLRAQRQGQTLDYWIEGAELMLFYADVALALHGGLDKSEAQALLARLEALQARTAELFAQTYQPTSVQEELAMRYAFHEKLLREFLG